MNLRHIAFRGDNLPPQAFLADGSQPLQYGLILRKIGELYPEVVARSAWQIEMVKYLQLDSMLLSEIQRMHRHTALQQNTIRVLEKRYVGWSRWPTTLRREPGIKRQLAI